MVQNVTNNEPLPPPILLQGRERSVMAEILKRMKSGEVPRPPSRRK